MHTVQFIVRVTARSWYTHKQVDNILLCFVRFTMARGFFWKINKRVNWNETAIFMLSSCVLLSFSEFRVRVIECIKSKCVHCTHWRTLSRVYKFLLLTYFDYYKRVKHYSTQCTCTFGWFEFLFINHFIASSFQNELKCKQNISIFWINLFDKNSVNICSIEILL